MASSNPPTTFNQSADCCLEGCRAADLRSFLHRMRAKPGICMGAHSSGKYKVPSKSLISGVSQSSPPVEYLGGGNLRGAWRGVMDDPLKSNGAFHAAPPAVMYSAE